MLWILGLACRWLPPGLTRLLRGDIYWRAISPAFVGVKPQESI
jgi:hypothetical protein